MKRKEVKVLSVAQEFDIIELNEVLLRFLDNMEEEVFAEKYTLEFNDSWDDLVCLSEELNALLNGKKVIR